MDLNKNMEKEFFGEKLISDIIIGNYNIDCIQELYIVIGHTENLVNFYTTVLPKDFYESMANHCFKKSIVKIQRVLRSSKTGNDEEYTVDLGTIKDISLEYEMDANDEKIVKYHISIKLI